MGFSAAIRARSAAVCAALAAGALLLAGCGGDKESSAPSVSIDAPDDGSTVESPVHVVMSADGLDIESAGAVREGAGHFHLLVDAPCDAVGAVAPAGPQRLRLDDGSSEADVPLAAGDHTLCLQAADGSHAALAPTDEITVNVTDAGGDDTEPTDTTETTAGGERWEGTAHGPFKAGKDCGAGMNTSEFTVVVDSGNDVTGGGSVSATAYTCRTPQGTARIPEMTVEFTITGRKEPTFFLLTYSTGNATIKIPYAGSRGRVSIDNSVGDYISRSTITMRCVNC